MRVSFEQKEADPPLNLNLFLLSLAPEKVDVMAKTYKARGVVLHTLKYGESSLIAYLLTDVGGRRTYMLPGACSRRTKGNLSALFQPMFLVEFEGFEPPRGEMHRMKEVRSLLPLRNLPFDMRKSTIALFMAEVLYRLVREVEQNSPLFEFVLGAVERLDALEEGVANFHLWFLVRLSSHLGFYPGNEPTPGCCFDIPGGIFCPTEPAHGIAMNPAAAHLLGELMGLESSRLDKLMLSRSQRSEFTEAMLHFFGYHFDAIHQVRSLSTLREVFQ